MHKTPLSQELKIIPPDDLIDLGDFVQTHPIKIDLVYGRADHPNNMFKTAIYRKGARMWAHKNIVPVILSAAVLCQKETGLLLELKDCLRTVEAQEAMRQSDIVKAHPEWQEEPNRLLSRPGLGAHPRAMAIDVVLVNAQGDEMDMGTPFDYLPPDKNNNPSARSYVNLPKNALDNRLLLQKFMIEGAKENNRNIVPLPQEWWDFRFANAETLTYAPLMDANLPPEMRMTQI